jgi:hypothetical protein
LILQWGFVQTDAVGDSTWTFPIPFSTAVYHVSGNDVLGDTARLVTFGTPGLSSVTAFITGAGTGVSSTAQVFAIGK